jgi:hypothetical protein
MSIWSIELDLVGKVLPQELVEVALNLLPLARLYPVQVQVLALLAHQQTALDELQAQLVVLQSHPLALGPLCVLHCLLLDVVLADGLGQEVPVEPVDALPQAQLDLLEGADDELGAVQRVDQLGEVQLGDLQQVLHQLVAALHCFFGLLFRHLQQLEDHGVGVGVELDGCLPALEGLFGVGFPLGARNVDQLYQVSAGKVSLRVKLILAVEVLQVQSRQFPHWRAQAFLHLFLAEGLLELNFAEDGVPSQVGDYLFPRKLMRQQETSVDAFLRELPLVVDGRHH